MKKPNFFIIGSVKCGTTTLFSYLQKSPEVFLPLQKEPHYFITIQNNLGYEGPDDTFFFEKYPRTLLVYESLFLGADHETAVGEASTMYMYYRDVAKQLYEYNPNSKIIALIRNPVERAFSHYLHHIREGTVAAGSFYDAIRDELDGKRDGWAPQRKFVEIGRYSGQLKQYVDVFPEEQILVLKFEDFIKNPNRILGEVSAFLGIENIYKDTSVGKHNASGVPKFEKLHSMYLSTLRLTRRTFPFLTHSPLSAVRKKIDNIYRNNFLKKPKMDDRSRKLLQDTYREEVKSIENLLKIDLSDWK